MRSGGIDAHVHLADPACGGAAGWAEAVASGVRSAVVCGAVPDDWASVRAAAAGVGGVAVLGIHPWFAATLDERGLAGWLDALAAARPAGIGEVGLDRSRGADPVGWTRQEAAVLGQLALARAQRVPVVWHLVRAYPEGWGLLRRSGGAPAGGMVHGWTGPADWVPRYVEAGLCISFGPAVVGPRGERLRAAVRATPRDALLLETDAPGPRRPGAPSERSAGLWAVCAAVAALREEPEAEVWAAAANNARRLWPTLGSA